MYYPIIDKLKELMTDLTSVKAKEPLIIEGSVTSQTGGTWSGNWNDILYAFEVNRPVYFRMTMDTRKCLIPVVYQISDRAESGIIYINQVLARGLIMDNNTFQLALLN